MTGRAKSPWKRIRNGVYTHASGRFIVKRAEFGQKWFVHHDGKVNFVLSDTTLREAKANVERYVRNEAEDAKYAAINKRSRA